jgi:extracellular factor (EF) 3-hydroxypalmitic acid methyl ester biosynthesis protein
MPPRPQARGRKLRVLNIACGPAVEIQQFAKDPLVEECEFTLLDFNAETLKYATGMIESVAKDAHTTVVLSTILKSIHDLLKETSSRFDSQRALPSYDLVYCAGLFDYLSDKICQRLVRLFVNMTCARRAWCS